MKKRGYALGIVLIMMSALLILGTAVSSGVINTIKNNKRYSNNVDLELEAKSGLNVARDILVNEIEKNKNDLDKIDINLLNDKIKKSIEENDIDAKILLSKVNDVYTVKSESPREGSTKFKEEQDIRIRLGGGNNEYVPDEDFDPNKKYYFGDLVNLKGVIYMCRVEESKGYEPDDRRQMGNWYGIGAVDGSIIEFNPNVVYLPGVIVKTKINNVTEEYMFTPIDNNMNVGNDSRYANFDSIFWTKINKGTNLDAPPKLAIPPKVQGEKKFIDYIKIRNSRDEKFETGKEYCYQNNIYRCLNGQAATDYRDTVPNDYYSAYRDRWEIVSPYYEYNNVKYRKGDSVWYEGRKYTAIKDMMVTRDNTRDLEPAGRGYKKYWELSVEH